MAAALMMGYVRTCAVGTGVVRFIVNAGVRQRRPDPISGLQTWIGRPQKYNDLIAVGSFFIVAGIRSGCESIS